MTFENPASSSDQAPGRELSEQCHQECPADWKCGEVILCAGRTHKRCGRCSGDLVCDEEAHTCTQPPNCNEEIYHHEDQSDYRGCQTKTRCGHTCQKWTDISPHEHGFDVGLYGDVGLGSHNYCRNPGHSDQGIWCFTTDPNKRWELCDPAGNPTREFDHYCEGTDPSDIDGGVHAYDWHRIRDTLMAANHVVQEDTPAEVAVQEQEMVDFLSVTPPPHHGMDKDHTNIIILFSCVMGVMLMIVIFCIWYTRRLMKSSYKQLKQERKKVTTKARKATYQHRFDDMLPKTPLSSELGKANFQRQRDFTAMSEMTASEKSAFPSGVL